MADGKKDDELLYSDASRNMSVAPEQNMSVAPEPAPLWQVTDWSALRDAPPAQPAQPAQQEKLYSEAGPAMSLMPEQPPMSVSPTQPAQESAPGQPRIAGRIVEQPGGAGQPIEIRVAPGRMLPSYVARPAIMSREDVETALQRQGQADAARVLAADQARAALRAREDAAIDAQAQLLAAQQEHEKQLAAARQSHAERLAEADKRIDEAKVDPTRYLRDMSTGQKTLSILALLMGGLGAALTRSDRNLALEVLQQQIDRDIAAQQQALQDNKQRREAIVRDFGSEEAYLERKRAAREAAVLRGYEMAIANADNDAKRAELEADLANFAEASLERAARRAQQRTEALALTRPVYAGGGATGPSIANRDEVIARLVAAEPDPSKRVALVERLGKARDTDLLALARSHGIAPMVAIQSGGGGATDAARNAAQEELRKVEEARNAAIAKGDYGAADALAHRATALWYRANMGAEASPGLLEEITPRTRSWVGKTLGAISEGVGASDPATLRAEQYLRSVVDEGSK